MSAFNLVDEPWIPVRLPDGRRDELGIREVLLQSHEIAVIEDPSPLVVAALHRLLLAVLYRALTGPTDIDQAKEWFRDGFPMEQVKAYLAKWYDRFWLYDEARPFFQVPGYEPQEKRGKKEWRSWPVIAAEHNADNAKVLFDHVDVSLAGQIPSGKAARWLVACQAFALGGGNSDFGYTKSAPSATAAMALPLGQSLRDTLLLSLVPENREVLAADRPIWEQEPASVALLKRGALREAMGIADLYTWASRSIKLSLEGNGAALSELAFAAGVICSSEAFRDPMIGFRVSEEKGRLPIRFGERGLWRNFDSLLPDGSDLAPRVIVHAAALTPVAPKRAPSSVMVLGQANDKAKVEYWRMEVFALPLSLRGDHTVREEVRKLLVEAEEAYGFLSKSCRAFARNVLGHGKRALVPEDVSSFVAQMPVGRSYWSALESRFHQVLRDYAHGADSEDVRREWHRAVRKAANMSWEQYRASVSIGDAWVIRAIVGADAQMLRGLRSLDALIAQLEPQKEGL